MGPRIQFHSDCPFFAGCENMLVNFFNDQQFMRDFRVSFSYRSSPAYETEFKRRVTTGFDIRPLRIPDFTEYANKFSFKPIRIAVKIVFLLFFVKYWFILWNTLVLYRMFGKEKIDLLHINNGGYPGAYSCMSAVFAAKLRGIRRIVYVVNNLAFPYTTLQRRMDFPLDRIVAKTVAVFVTGSAYAGEKLKEVLKLPSSRHINIHNGIAPRIVTESRQEVLKRLEIEDGRLLIAVVAVIEERKGHIYLLKALKLLKEQGYDNKMPLVLIEGNGSVLQGLIEYVRENGLADDVKFIGDEAGVFNFMHAVDVIALPSIANEDFPNVVLEAMSLGKPVIASRLAGTPEQVIHMETGILVEPRDVFGLAEAIRMLADNRPLCKLMGENGLRRFNDNFSAGKSVSNYVKLYHYLLKEGDI